MVPEKGRMSSKSFKKKKKRNFVDVIDGYHELQKKNKKNPALSNVCLKLLKSLEIVDRNYFHLCDILMRSYLLCMYAV